MDGILNNSRDVNKLFGTAGPNLIKVMINKGVLSLKRYKWPRKGFRGNNFYYRAIE
jgi:hypothetical protein